MFAAARVFSGSAPGEPLRELVAQVAPTPLLLIAAGSIPGEIPLNLVYAALLLVATTWLDAMATDPERNALMNQRPIPGFTPSADAYAFALKAIERLHRFLDRCGITDPDAADLWTAVLAGLASQQNANDPGGERWLRLTPRAVDMFLSEVGPGTTRRKKTR